MVQQRSLVMTLTAAAAIGIATSPAPAQFEQCPNDKGGNCHEATPGIGGCCDEACCNMVCDVDPVWEGSDGASYSDQELTEVTRRLEELGYL